MRSIKKYNKIRTWKAYLKCWHTKCEAGSENCELRTAELNTWGRHSAHCAQCPCDVRGKGATKRITIKWKTKGSQGKCEIHSIAAPPTPYPLLPFQPCHSLLQRMRKYENWVKICKCNEILFSLAKDTRQQQEHQEEEDEQATSHMTSRIYLVTPGPPMPTWHSPRTPEIYA